MGFIEDAQTLRAKAHASDVPKPVLAGIVVVAAVVAVLAVGGIVGTVASVGEASFEVSRSDGAQEEGASDAGLEGAPDAGPGSGDAVSGSSQASSETPGTIFVHVAGAVAAPGVYELPAGSRLQAAVDAAGGFAPGAAQDAVNLAQEAADGQQVVVPTQEQAAALPDAVGSESAAEGPAGAAAGGKVNINTATEAELDTLPGVGPSTAAKIVADREQNGAFQSPEDLKRVSGIGDKKFEQLAGLITI